MRLFQKLVIGNLVGVAAIMAALFGAVRSIDHTEGELDRIHEQILPVTEALQNLRFSVIRSVSSTSEYLYLDSVGGQIDDKEEVEASLKVEKLLIESGKKTYKDALAKLNYLVTEYFPDQIEEKNELQAQGEAFFALLDGIIAKLDKNANPGEMFEAKEQLEVVETKFLGVIAHVLLKAKAQVSKRHDDIEGNIQERTYFIYAQTLSAFLVLLGASFLFSRSLISRIRKLKNATADIASGNFIQITPDDSSDELGSLHRDFCNMTKTLQKAEERNQFAEQEMLRHRDLLQEKVDMATAELKTKADELSQALAREKELNEMQRQFVSMASHEFRTPLAIIDSTAQRMRSRADKNRLTPEDAVLRVEKIRGAVRRMTQLMESTLTAARMEEGHIAVEIGPCNISEVLRDVCSRQQEIAKDHIITYDLAGLPETIQADCGAIDQVFTNLLSNAVKYAPGAPHIEVMTSTENDNIVISVRDYGLGIDEDDLPKMFGQFFRAKTSVGIAGTGIGLNLLKSLVEMHDGSIDVESKKGEGSVFTVRLPVAGPQKTRKTEGRAA